MFREPLRVLKGQRGEGALSLPLLMLLVFMFLYMGIDFFAIYSVSQKLRVAASETLVLMKINNGWDTETEDYFREMLDRVGLDKASVKVDNYTEAKVNRKDTVVLEVSTEYTVRSIKPLNKEVKIPVQIRLSGLAQGFDRQ